MVSFCNTIIAREKGRARVDAFISTTQLVCPREEVVFLLIFSHVNVGEVLYKTKAKVPSCMSNRGDL